MPQTRTSCPRCRQPITAEIEQLFDMNTDPQAKQRFLSGGFNIAHCPVCGYEGSLSMPLVYHDPEKELLLTYFPPELGLPVNEQEKLIGPFINQVVSRLPNDKRKAYLFRPQNMLTLQTMAEKILEADGITKEMLEAQQKRIALIQRLMTTPPESRVELIHMEEANIDEDFFNILTRLIEASISQGDQQTARQFAAIQQDLLAETKMGQEIQNQAKEAEEAVKALQEASKKGLTREKLLDLLIEAQSDVRLTTLVSMARTGMDYSFFQLLTEKIDQAAGDEKTRLAELREKLVEMTKEIDQAIQEQLDAAREGLNLILGAPDIEAAVEANLHNINEFFIEVLKAEMLNARQNGDMERINKLQTVYNVLQRASAPPPEVALVNDLLTAQDEPSRKQILEAHREEITSEFIQALGSLINQAEAENQPQQIKDQLNAAYKSALRFSMESNLKK